MLVDQMPVDKGHMLVEHGTVLVDQGHMLVGHGTVLVDQGRMLVDHGTVLVRVCHKGERFVVTMA